VQCIQYDNCVAPLFFFFAWPKLMEMAHCRYMSHFLSTWSDRMWEFAIALLLINIWPDTMLLVALFGFTESIAVVLGGPVVGDWVDTHPRLEVVSPPCRFSSHDYSQMYFFCIQHSYHNHPQLALRFLDIDNHF